MTRHICFALDIPDDPDLIAEYEAEYEARHAPEPPEVGAWEELMWRFQRPLAHAARGEKWVGMQRIFALDEQFGAPTASELRKG